MLETVLGTLALVALLATLGAMAALVGVDSRETVGDSHRGGEHRPWL